jgi:hypothetical protein
MMVLFRLLFSTIGTHESRCSWELSSLNGLVDYRPGNVPFWIFGVTVLLSFGYFVFVLPLPFLAFLEIMFSMGMVVSLFVLCSARNTARHKAVCASGFSVKIRDGFDLAALCASFMCHSLVYLLPALSCHDFLLTKKPFELRNRRNQKGKWIVSRKRLPIPVVSLTGLYHTDLA